METAWRWAATRARRARDSALARIDSTSRMYRASFVPASSSVFRKRSLQLALSLRSESKSAERSVDRLAAARRKTECLERAASASMKRLDNSPVFSRHCAPTASYLRA